MWVRYSVDLQTSAIRWVDMYGDEWGRSYGRVGGGTEFRFVTAEDLARHTALYAAQNPWHDDSRISHDMAEAYVIHTDPANVAAEDVEAEVRRRIYENAAERHKIFGEHDKLALSGEYEVTVWWSDKSQQWLASAHRHPITRVMSLEDMRRWNEDATENRLMGR